MWEHRDGFTHTWTPTLRETLTCPYRVSTLQGHRAFPLIVLTAQQSGKAAQHTLCLCARLVLRVLRSSLSTALSPQAS